MKTTLIRGSVILVMIILGVLLFISGKEHTIYITNNSENYTPKVAYYILDGMEEVKVKKKKKKREYVKGSTHRIDVRYKCQDGKEINISKDFKVKIGEELTINLATLEKK